jgi:hypothetical protein
MNFCSPQVQVLNSYSPQVVEVEMNYFHPMEVVVVFLQMVVEVVVELQMQLLNLLHHLLH